MSTRLAWLRFVLACLLFAGWIGWLGYLAATKRNPVVLSRPQLLVSDVDVVAEVDDPDKPVVVREVLDSRAGLAFTAGEELKVTNLKDCRRQRRYKEPAENVPMDLTGPGLYLLPLRVRKRTPEDNANAYATILLQNQPFAAAACSSYFLTTTYEVVVIPPSPGFPPPHDVPTPRIYPATEEVRAEYDRMPR